MDRRTADRVKLHQWSLQKNNYGFALSNPKFELWLLLHFEDVGGTCDSKECSQRLDSHLPGYDKNIDVKTISIKMIADAIGRAKKLDSPPCHDWPRTTGTTVYKLVENILNNNKNQQ